MKRVTPQTWAEDLSGPPVLTSSGLGWRSGLLRRWRGVQANISQPPLDHHYLVLHLGGPKRVKRTGMNGTLAVDIGEGGVTIVPAGTRYEWQTEGPIDFAHLYIHPARLNHAISLIAGREGSARCLEEKVGVNDPLLTQLLREMLDELQHRGGEGSPYTDALFDAVLSNLASKHASASVASHAPARHALAPIRLRRVLDHIEGALGHPIDLAGLAKVAGLSRFHFSRAFHNAMGEPPLTYVQRRRLDMAKRLLRGSEMPLAQVAREIGFASASHFSDTFKRHTGLQPSQYRRQL